MPKNIVIMDKYSYMRAYRSDQINPRLISEESLTVPDLVMSMADIYRKYAVTRDISSLPGVVRPIVQDIGDLDDDPLPEIEENVDVMYESRRIRSSVVLPKARPVEPPKTELPPTPSVPPEEKEPSDDDEGDKME